MLEYFELLPFYGVSSTSFVEEKESRDTYTGCYRLGTTEGNDRGLCNEPIQKFNISPHKQKPPI